MIFNIGRVGKVQSSSWLLDGSKKIKNVNLCYNRLIIRCIGF